LIKQKNLRQSAEKICENLRETFPLFQPVQISGEIPCRSAQMLTQIFADGGIIKKETLFSAM
jgi:hypothetical protein